MQKIKDGLYEIGDFIQVCKLGLEKLNIADCFCFEPVLKEARYKIDTLIEYVEDLEHKK